MLLSLLGFEAAFERDTLSPASLHPAPPFLLLPLLSLSHISLSAPPSFPPDIAIAAPYGGEDRKGIVYIFNGRSAGLNAAPSQALEGRWAAQSMPPSFGYAMKGATDIDRNGYPGAATLNVQVLSPEQTGLC